MHRTVIDRVAKKMPQSVAVVVRAASVNKKTGRSLFDFEDVTPGCVAVGAVFRGGRMTDEFYVIPGLVCPKKLLIKPGSESTKWRSFYCSGIENLGPMIERMAAYQPPSDNPLLRELS